MSDTLIMEAEVMMKKRDTVQELLQEEQCMKSKSPFQPLSRVLRAFQVLGIFNFSFHSDCGRFVHRPLRSIYTLFLNAFFLSIPIGCNLLWINASDISLEELQMKIDNTFSKTDFIALVGVILLLQVTNIGLHLNSVSLGNHLNGLIDMDSKLGEFGQEQQQQHPGARTLFRTQGTILTLLFCSQFLTGFSFTSVIGFDPSLSAKICLGLSQAVSVLYNGVCKICYESLFLRMVHVLGFRYQRLLEQVEENRTNKDKGCDDTNAVLDHMLGLVELFRSVEKAFQRQLLIQNSLLMGALIFGIYLTISFLIASKDCSHGLFTVGFVLFSFVPALKLATIVSSVGHVIVQIQAVRMHLYELEASAKNEETKSKIRLTIRKYKGVDGFSACNYFTVNPQLFTSIMGYLTTYIIVMIQFKLAEISFRRTDV